MQLLGLLMDRSLRRSGRRATILAATSGDTGAAAVEAFKNREAIDLFVLFPNGRISAAQRRQMTTVGRRQCASRSRSMVPSTIARRS